MNYYISDLHFFHKHVTGEGDSFDGRPYATIAEMHEDMKNRWNRKITNGDTVYILGDVSMRGGQEALIALVSTLKGHKILIRGNHDDTSDLRYQSLYEEICDYKEITDRLGQETVHLVLSHYPIMMWKNQHRGWIHLYGHLHNTREYRYFQRLLAEMNREDFEARIPNGQPIRAYNVGCMLPYMDYEPRTLEEIVRGSYALRADASGGSAEEGGESGMKVYCMSDIHGFLGEFEEALSLVEEHLAEDDVRLLLLGDYIHGGADNRGVLDRIMELQDRYGTDKVVALRGNHEEFVLLGDSDIDHLIKTIGEDDNDDGEDDKYIRWLEDLPLYYTEGNTIFVHAGIDEEAGDLWEWETGEDTFIGKYPAETGQIEGLEMKVVAGHIGTAEISDDPRYHDIYYDGASHYYIDGTVLESGRIPVLKVDTGTDKYYRVTEAGDWPILPYEEEK